VSDTITTIATLKKVNYCINTRLSKILRSREDLPSVVDDLKKIKLCSIIQQGKVIAVNPSAAISIALSLKMGESHESTNRNWEAFIG